MSNLNIRAAFAEALEAIPTMPVIAWENLVSKIDSNAMYLKPNLLPAETLAAGLGADADNFFHGLYQISVNAPSGSGSFDAQVIAESLLTRFARGCELTYTYSSTGVSTTVRVKKSYIDKISEDEDRYRIYVVIDYFAYQAPN